MLKLRIFLKNYWESQVDEHPYVKYDEHFSEAEPCNIYMIGIKPRVILDQSYFKIKGNNVELKFKVQNKYEFDEFVGEIPLNRSIKGELRLETTPPYSRFNLKDDIGYLFDVDRYSEKFEVKCKSSYALRIALGNLYDSNSMEILYIGKSLKMDAKVSAIKRMQSHSKMQQILNKCTTEYFDKEVYVLLCSFVSKIDLLATPEELTQLQYGEDILANLNANIHPYLRDKEMITQITEAGLIDFFDTKAFNVDFIGAFGRPSHKYFEPIKKSNISRVSFQIDLSELCDIYSEKREKNNNHMFIYFPQKNYELGLGAF